MTWDAGQPGRHATVMDPVLAWLRDRPGLPAHYRDIARALHQRPASVNQALHYVLRAHPGIPVQRTAPGFYAWTDGRPVPVQSGRAPSAIIRASMADVQIAGILAQVAGRRRIPGIIRALDGARQDIPHNGGIHSHQRKQAQ